MARVFVERRPELRALEGWYDAGAYKFKLSCRFKDILRCSEFNGKKQHFNSCFRKEGIHREQPTLRCYDPNWAIIYTPDKHGNFLGRMFVQWRETPNGIGYLELGKVYGNYLKEENIMTSLKLVECRSCPVDRYLPNN